MANQLDIVMLEHLRGQRSYRGLSIEHHWDMPEGEFKFRFSVDGTDDGGVDPMHKPRIKRIATRDKLRFLRDILETEVDIAQTEDKFGAPYMPGALRPNSDQLLLPEERSPHFNYTGYWVRDMAGQLPALPGAAPALNTVPTRV